MSRLTKNVLYFENSQSVNDKKLCVKAFNKLSNLEYLEDELGCPLEVVFKALKEGVKVFNNSIVFPKLYYDIVLNCWCFAITNEIYTKLKDYGKTWWLKGEKEHEED